MNNQNLPYGVDISRYQYSADGRQKIDFDKLNPLIKFCGVRAGISWGYTDPWYEYSKAHLLCPRMDYHVLYPGEDANRQMDHFLRIANPQEHDRLVLDLELDHGYTRWQITQTLLTCLERLKSETGRYPIVYSRAYWVNQFLYVSDLPIMDWWLANYLTAHDPPAYTPEHPGPPILPAGVNTWLIHQTGDRGNGGSHGVASHYIDQNRWNGTEEEMLTYFGMQEESHEVYLPIVTTPEKPLYTAQGITEPPFKPRVRATPNGKIVRLFKQSEKVNVFEEVEDWLRIDDGWIAASWVQKDNDRPDLMEVPLFSQRDPRWANDKMGSSNITLGQQGCLVTATAAGLTYLGWDIDPKEYNRLASARGGYQPPNLMYWKFPDVLTEGKIVRAEYSGWYSTGKGWEMLADTILSSDRPVWAHVDFDCETSTIEQHWVLIIGQDAHGYWVYDPWLGTIASLSARYDGKVYRIVSYRKAK